MQGGGVGYYSCHLIEDRGQGCCLISYNVQDSPPEQNIIQPKMLLVLRMRNPALDNCRLKDYRKYNSNIARKYPGDDSN